MNTALKLSLATVVAFGLAACGKNEKGRFIYMPDMVYSPAIKNQEGAQREPVKGTIPRGHEPYAFRGMPTSDPENTVAVGAKLTNPVPLNRTTLARGKHVYNTYCLVCHGAYGEGDGTVVPKFPRPPSLQSDKVRGYKDGSIFHVITMGQNLMPSYAMQVPESDRWSAIHYLRALQKAKNPTPQDLKDYDADQARLQAQSAGK